MSSSTAMSTMTNPFDQVVPNGRQSLCECFSNLERVAAYCEANYLQMPEKDVLQETKRFAVQSLASVAYQVNTLATNFLSAVDVQCEKISDLERLVNLHSQEIAIYKEKVARREIGVLTTNRAMQRFHQIVAPAQQARERRYVRSPIDYSRLDDIGHGLMTAQQPHNVVSIGLTSATSTAPINSNYLSFPVSSNYSVFPSVKVSSVSKAVGKEYRTPVTIAPPIAPEVDRMQVSYPGMVQVSYMNYAMRSEPGHYRTSSAYGMRMAETNYAQQRPFEDEERTTPGSNSLNLPFCPKTLNAQKSAESPELLPPLPPESMLYAVTSPSSPKLHGDHDGTDSALVHLRRNHSHLHPADSWVPKNYIEKVTAIYDYVAEKPDELSFQENAIIYVLRKNEDGWYEGVMDGVTGLFPGNYVEPCI